MAQNSVQKYNKTFNTLLHLQTAFGLCDHREPLYDKGNQYMITVAARGRGGGQIEVLKVLPNIAKWMVQIGRL
jgi:hypothetical protein